MSCDGLTTTSFSCDEGEYELEETRAEWEHKSRDFMEKVGTQY